MENSEKLKWIKKNSGNPYPVLWLRISKVADFYHFCYNHWKPRGNTGYLDADCFCEPNALWNSYEKIITEEFERSSFAHLFDEASREKVPFVLEHDYDSIPDEDPRWSDAAFEPPLVPTSMYQCLFGSS